MHIRGTQERGKLGRRAQLVLRNGIASWIEWLQQASMLSGVFARYALFRVGSARRAQRRRNPVTQARRSVLCISYFSTPYKSVFGTQRLDKFVKYLGQAGWHVILITTEPAAHEIDADAEGLPKGTTIIRLRKAESARLAWKGVLIPDHFGRFIEPALRAGMQAIEELGPSLIFATVPPYSNALAAMLLSMKSGLPLISDFRDPWAKIDTGWVIPNPAKRRISSVLERMVLQVSSRVVMADESHYADAFFSDARPHITRKLCTIFNGYDDDDFAQVQTIRRKEKRTKFVVSYVGVFYDRATFENVRRAFDYWQLTFPDELHDVELHYAGASSNYFDIYNFRPPYLKDHGYVTHRNAIAIRLASDVQVFSQPPSFKPHVISGKIYEMIRTPVPILAITDPSGTVARFVERIGGVVACNRDPTAAGGALRRMYIEGRNRQGPLARDERAVSAFSRRAQAARLVTLMEQLVAGSTEHDSAA